MKPLCLFFILTIFLNLAFASEKITCDPYYLNSKNNPLFNLGLVGGNSKNPDDTNSDDLFPNKQFKSKKNIWTQYFYLKKYSHYKNIMLVCVYNNGQSIVKQIPKSMQICTLKFSTAKLKNNPSSIIKFNCN